MIIDRTTRWSPAFRQLYAVTVADGIGHQVALLAVPVLAVAVLHATPAQVGLLGVLGTAAFLLIGLPAGVWVDRSDRRAVMIAADVVRAALFASVPLAWWAGRLTMGQLYLVVLVAGAGTVFAEIAAQSCLPAVVGRERLVAANSALMSTQATIQIGGRALGGFLVQSVGAPVALIGNAVAHALSAVVLSRLRPDAAPGPTAPAPGSFGRQLADGVRHVLGHALLRPLALSLASINLTVNLMTTMLPVVFLRDLGLGAGPLGLFLAAGGVGALLGAVTARPLAARIGHGRALWLPGLLVAPAGLLVPLVDTGVTLWLAGFGWLAIAWRTGIGNVIGVSLRQTATPDALLGRMNAVFRFLLFGAIAVGAALSGLLGQYADVRTPLWIGAVGAALTWLPVFRSPLRALAAPPTAAPRDRAADADRAAPATRTGR
ncbi:MFS transporter [Micromonospora sp. URMC 105]|uniref:MFS transporter n=1 Tax=Micromonospora sp. URMC 105 TaxID=3423413 RepID=UPI003F1A86E5